jgi:short-subunit dehydrogenase
MEENTVVVITGASSGIGRATALELAQQGANLVLVARREAALHGLAQECERLGGKALPIPTDVAIEEHVYGVARRATERYGKIDVWINNAAVTVAGQFDAIPMEDFRRVLEINLFGYIYGSRAAITQFKKQGHGTLINVSSIVAVSGEPYFSPYTISKYAIRGLSISLHQEVEKENIHVCTVLPGVIDTPIYNQAANYMGKAVIPPGNALPAEDVAASIIDLIDHPQREVFVGSKGRLAEALQILVPGLFDKTTEKRILEKHFDQQREMGNSKGNLYEPMREYASVSGGWIKQTKNRLKYVVPATVLAGAAIGVAWALSHEKKTAEATK